MNNMRKNFNFFAEPFRTFFYWESSSGFLLLLCAIVALVLANSPYASLYEHFLHMKLPVGIGDLQLELSLLHWINDGLMAIFFFAIGLEIKREFLYGELKNRSAMLLPATAALGGMLVPALFYVAVNWGESTIGGWGIPMATDIAFALGIMTLAARSAPIGLVIFLTALAIVDDLGAIIVIALFYTNELHTLYLFFGLLTIAAAFLLPRIRLQSVWFYLFLGLLSWLAFYKAGIHPTVAGVLLGLSIPASERPEHSMLHHLEHRLEPWSAYVIMPVFALANAGVTLSFSSFDFTSPLFLGILLGLCVGKPLGIVGAVVFLNRTLHIPVPGNASVAQTGATGMLSGIGFTMSIFIASLAFDDPLILDQAKISILFASLLSGIIGAVIFQVAKGKTADEEIPC